MYELSKTFILRMGTVDLFSEQLLGRTTQSCSPAQFYQECTQCVFCHRIILLVSETYFNLQKICFLVWDVGFY
jgi:hypothetical protein